MPALGITKYWILFAFIARSIKICVVLDKPPSYHFAKGQNFERDIISSSS